MANDNDSESQTPAWKLDAAWKILDINIKFSQHFDFKPAVMLAIAGGLTVPLGSRLKAIFAGVNPGATWHFWAWVEAGLLTVCAVCLFLTFLMILGAVSPTAAASFGGLLPWAHKKPDRNQTSLIYFGDIAHYSRGITHTGRRDPANPNLANSKAWLEQFEKLNEEQLLAELADQITENAIIAADKTKRLRAAAQWLIIALSIAGLSFFLLPMTIATYTIYFH